MLQFVFLCIYVCFVFVFSFWFLILGEGFYMVEMVEGWGLLFFSLSNCIMLNENNFMVDSKTEKM